MFEDSTFESLGTIKTRSSRWSLAALALNGSILSALVLFPLLHPDALPHRFLDVILAPPPAPHAPDPVPAERTAQQAQSARAIPLLDPSAPTAIPHFIDRRPIYGNPAPPTGTLAMDEPGTGIPGGDPAIFRKIPPVAVAPKPHGPLTVSQGVAAGMLLYKTIPAYPAIARAARIQGTVVLEAVISKDGAIENLRVASGPAMLQQSALDAVRQWRYRPYLLNNNPVEVETTIKVVFTLGS